VKLLALGILTLLLVRPVVAGDKLDDTFQSLKDAVAKKDAAQVKKLALELTPVVQAELAAPAPAGDDEKKAWTDRVQYVKSVGEYTEYALYAVAIQSPAAVLVDLVATLEKVNACSKYLNQAYGPYFMALNQTGAAAKIPAIAEEALKEFPENEDLLLVAMENARNHSQADRALAYANRLTAALAKRAKPETMAAADWERKRTAMEAQGYYVAGVIQAQKGVYAAADKSLRAALPLVKGNGAMLGPTLFYLGMADYNLGKMTLNKKLVLEAAQFSEQAAAVPGQFADQARHNALVMKAEADRMR